MTNSAKPVFPIALLLEGRACLVVGSGAELTSRTRALLEANLTLPAEMLVLHLVT